MELKNLIMIITPVIGVVALAFAVYLALAINKRDAGNDRMKEISGNIEEGAQAFLFSEYKILVVFAVILFILITVLIDVWTAICFVVGALFSTVAGYCGMRVATKANVRTAQAAKDGGLNKALKVAFSGGAVMGMSVVGLGVIGIGAIFFIISKKII